MKRAPWIEWIEEYAIDFIERIGKGGDSTAAYRNKTILNTLKTEGIYGYNDGGNSTSYKNVVFVMKLVR